MKLPGNLQNLMEQAQKMQESIHQVVEKIKVDAMVGGGAVIIQMDGKKIFSTSKSIPRLQEKSKCCAN